MFTCSLDLTSQLIVTYTFLPNPLCSPLIISEPPRESSKPLEELTERGSKESCIIYPAYPTFPADR